MDELTRQFEKIGATVKVRASRTDTIDYRDGVYDLRLAADTEPFVTQVDAKQRALLLVLRQNGKHVKTSHFLCGHDERDFFVAAVPERPSTVRDALSKLKPVAIRKKEAKRQGEWFFVPAPDFKPAGEIVQRNEPLRRNNRSKPHIVEEFVRHGGELRWFSTRTSITGMDDAAREAYILNHPNERVSWQRNWVSTPAHPIIAYARGRVSHSDHKTLVLKGWHRIFMNTEGEANFGPKVVYID